MGGHVACLAPRHAAGLMTIASAGAYSARKSNSRARPVRVCEGNRRTCGPHRQGGAVMSQTPDSPAVKLARAHVEAWARKDFDTARNGLAPNVTVTTSSTNPDIHRGDLVGVDDYIQGLILFAQSTWPGQRPGDRQLRRRPVRAAHGDHEGGRATVREADDPQRPAIPVRRQRQDRSRASDLLHDSGLNQARPGTRPIRLRIGCPMPDTAAARSASRARGRKFAHSC